MFGQLALIDPIGEHQDRGLRGDLGDRRGRLSGEARLLGHDGEVIRRGRGSILAMASAPSPPGRLRKPGGAGAGLVLAAGHPGQLLGIAGADAAPQTGELRPVTDDDPTLHETPEETVACPLERTRRAELVRAEAGAGRGQC